MYGQFHNHQTLTRNARPSFTATASLPSKKFIANLISLLVVFSISATTFAGPKQPTLPGKNGNAQGR